MIKSGCSFSFDVKDGNIDSFNLLRGSLKESLWIFQVFWGFLLKFSKFSHQFGSSLKGIWKNIGGEKRIPHFRILRIFFYLVFESFSSLAFLCRDCYVPNSTQDVFKFTFDWFLSELVTFFTTANVSSINIVLCYDYFLWFFSELFAQCCRFPIRRLEKESSAILEVNERKWVVETKEFLSRKHWIMRNVHDVMLQL